MVRSRMRPWDGDYLIRWKSFRLIPISEIQSLGKYPREKYSSCGCSPIPEEAMIKLKGLAKR